MLRSRVDRAGGRERLHLITNKIDLSHNWIKSSKLLTASLSQVDVVILLLMVTGALKEILLSMQILHVRGLHQSPCV